MKKLIALLSLMIVSMLTSSAAACTDPRPTGQAGWVPTPGSAGPYVIGIRAGSSGMLVTWQVPGIAGTPSTLITWGNDTGITASGGYWPTPQNYANRVVSMGVGNTLVSGAYSQITLSFNGGAGTATINGTGGLVGPSLAWAGVGGALHMVKGVVLQDAGGYVGALRFVGTHNGAQVSTDMKLVGHVSCDDPGAALSRERSWRIARSFFPEVERATRQWWQS